jgi:hypothetical protein
MPITSSPVLAHLLMAGLVRRAFAAADMRDKAPETTPTRGGACVGILRGLAATPRPARGAVTVALRRHEGVGGTADLRT